MKLFFFVIFLMLMSFLPWSHSETAWSETWEKYAEYADGSVLSYDKDSIANRTRHIKQVWFRRDVSYTIREKTIERMQAQGVNIEGYDKLSYHIVLFVINCKDNKFKPLSTADFDVDGKELFRNSSIDQPVWDDINPRDPMMGRLSEIVCTPAP